MKKPNSMTKKMWNKFTREEQKRWVKCYDTFLEELRILSEIQNQTKAFNMACLVL